MFPYGLKVGAGHGHLGLLEELIWASKVIMIQVIVLGDCVGRKYFFNDDDISYLLSLQDARLITLALLKYESNIFGRRAISVLTRVYQVELKSYLVKEFLACIHKS